MKYRRMSIFRRNIERICHARLGGKIRKKLPKNQRYITDILKKKLVMRYDRQICSYFDPTVQISFAFLKTSTTIFFIQRLIINLKLDLTVQNDLYRIYDDLTVKFELKSNPTVRIKSH